jgi:hypothetical protein
MGILNAIVVLLLVFWLAGLALHIAGGFIHVLLLAALVVFVMRFFRHAV